jgi:hypothetical protein
LKATVSSLKGLAKKEMQKVINKQNDRIQELENHIKEGTKVLDEKSKLLKNEEPS